jgi:hypothetical protein
MVSQRLSLVLLTEQRSQPFLDTVRQSKQCQFVGHLDFNSNGESHTFSRTTVSDTTLVHPLKSVKANGGMQIGYGVSVTAAKSHSEPGG